MNVPGSGNAARGPVASILEGIPDAAMLVTPGRRILGTNERFRRTFAARGEARGRSCFEVCHGRSKPCETGSEACPLVSCLESGRSLRTLHVHASSEGDLHTELSLHPIRDESGRSIAALEVCRPVRIASARACAYRLVGRSESFNRALFQVTRLGPTERPILISGEAGTGKELFARALHEISARKNAPFVSVDGSALLEWRFEKELYGFENGSVAAAGSSTGGLLGAARGGTLFVREIEALPDPAQVSLLRLLETGTYRPDGASRERKNDVRLIFSSSVGLSARVRQGGFREELLLRIVPHCIKVPPLRERLDDLPLLIESVLMQLDYPARNRKVSDVALEVLRSHPFQGNLRELASLLEHAALLADGEIIRLEHLPEVLRLPPPGPGRLSFSGPVVPLAEAMRSYLSWAQESSGSTIRELARQLGVSERTLYRKLRGPSNDSA